MIDTGKDSIPFLLHLEFIHFLEEALRRFCHKLILLCQLLHCTYLALNLEEIYAINLDLDRGLDLHDQELT